MEAILAPSWRGRSNLPNAIDELLAVAAAVGAEQSGPLQPLRVAQRDPTT